MSCVVPALNQYVAIDCEMVRGFSGRLLCKVAIVDHTSCVLLESFVFVPPDEVREYLTEASGIEASHLEGAPTFNEISPQISDILKDKIVVGHALWNDLAASDPIPHLSSQSPRYHPLPPLREIVGVTRDSYQPSLVNLAMTVLGRDMRKGGGVAHDPVEDARAAMDIFLTVREAYEAALLEGKEMASVPKAYRKWYLEEPQSL